MTFSPLFAIGRTVEIAVSQLKLPAGQLGLIEHASRDLHNRLSPSTWLDRRYLKRLLVSHPIRVISAQRHFEVVGGFRVFRLAGVVCPPDELIDVQLVKSAEDELVEQALAELTASLFWAPSAGLAERRRAYHVLRDLSRSLKSCSSAGDAQCLSPRILRSILVLSPSQAERPRQRRSSYAIKMGATK